MTRLVTLREVAKWIGVPPVEIERWTREGKLPLAREGGMVGIEPDTLKRFLMAELTSILERRRSAGEELAARRVLATLCALGEGSDSARGAEDPRRVLVVDDSDAMANLAQIALRGLGPGIECLRAADGVAACNILASTPVDVAVIDVLMPNMDGIALCRLIRECVRLAGIRILVVSGLLGPKTRRELQEIGIDGMLEKPFRAEELFARVRALLFRAAAA